MVQVRCSNCGKVFSVKSYRLKRLKFDKITCSKECSNKIKSEIYKEMINPNFKYEKDLSMFYNLTHDGCYILGLIFSDGSIRRTSLTIYQSNKYNKNLYEISRMIFGTEDNVKIYKNDFLSLTINNKNLIDFILSLGGIKTGKKDNYVNIPNIPENKKWSFIAGYFDGDGGFKYNYRYPEIKITSNSDKMLLNIAKYWEVNYNGNSGIYAYGYKALDICGRMYENVSLRHNKKYDYYIDILNWEPLPAGPWFKDEVFKYKKLDKNAIPPYKKRVTDSGYDVTAIKLYKDEDSGLYIADTRLAVEPIPGYYFDLLGRGSLPVKNGLQFALGVGVIDRSYVGSLKMALIKINKKPLPKCPFRCGQLIPRKTLHVDFVEVDNLNEMERGNDGFGSIGV